MNGDDKIASTQCLMLFNISLRRHSHKCTHSFLMMLMYKKHFLFPWYCRGSEVKKMHSRALHVYSVPKVSVAINAKWLNVLSPFFCLSISDHTVGFIKTTTWSINSFSGALSSYYQNEIYYKYWTPNKILK